MESKEDDNVPTNDNMKEYYQEFISILFGIVLVQSLPRYGEILDPSTGSEIIWAELVALVTVHVGTILSWVGYHRQLSEYHYKIGTPLANLRFYDDVLIVILYSILASVTEWIRADPGSNRGIFGINISVTEIYLLLFIMVYILYLLNDIIVQANWDDYQNYVFIGANAVSLGALFLIYFLFSYKIIISNRLAVFILMFGLVLVYRWYIFSQDPGEL